MKKKYTHPATKIIQIQVISILSGSNRGVTSTKGLRYGGVDEDDEYEVE